MSISTCIKCGGHVDVGPEATNRCISCGTGLFADPPARSPRQCIEAVLANLEMANGAALLNHNFEEADAFRQSINLIKAECFGILNPNA